MKLLVDSCISEFVAYELRRLGHDVVWAGDRQPDPGDESLLNEAFGDNRVLVTLDKDFGELAVVFAKPHHGILRITNFRTRQQAQVIQQVIELHGNELQSGAIITAEPGRLRVRPGDDSSDNTSNQDTGLRAALRGRRSRMRRKYADSQLRRVADREPTTDHREPTTVP